MVLHFVMMNYHSHFLGGGIFASSGDLHDPLEDRYVKDKNL